MSFSKFYYPVTIRECHLDTFGHVNNATYLALFEEARWELITNNGYGLQQIKTNGIGPTVLEISIRFLKELRLREKIIIESQILSYEKKIGKLRQSIMRDDELCCVAEFTIGLFDLQQRKLILPTPEWLKAVGIQDT